MSEQSKEPQTYREMIEQIIKFVDDSGWGYLAKGFRKQLYQVDIKEKALKPELKESIKMNFQRYHPTIIKIEKSIFTGGDEIRSEHKSEDLTHPMLKGWLDDDDFQELVLLSSNLGLENRFIKQLRS
jgi:hypothetical protein